MRALSLAVIACCASSYALSCRSVTDAGATPRMHGPMPAAPAPAKVEHAPAPVEHAPAAPAGPPRAQLEPIAPSALCVSSGTISSAGARRLHVDAGGMRGVIAHDRSRSAELAFTYRGASTSTAPLADGELRRQIGLKLRAQDTCNVVYVMWHIEPSPGIFVLVKHNAGKSTHSECGDGGYVVLKSDFTATAPLIQRGAPSVLRADIEGTELRVSADGVDVWRGRLPREAFSFDGPVGVRTDNGAFDFELRVPGGRTSGGSCPRPD